MEDPSRSPATSARMSNYYTILGLPKTASLQDICGAYKSLIIKWNPDRHPSNKDEAEAKFQSINEAYDALIMAKTEEANALRDETLKPPKSDYKIDIPKTPKKSKRTSFDAEELQISSPILISSTSDRVTINPSSSTPSLSSSSRRSTTPTRLSGEFFTGTSRSSGEFFTGSSRHSGEFFTGSSRHSGEFFTGASRNSSGANTPTTPHNPEEAVPLSSLTSKRNSTPIVYSHSTTTLRRKPPPIQKKLECTLEELCHGCVKKVMITRDVISHFGVIVQEEEWLTIKVKPGWKKGTKLLFEGKGDERPGFLPADIIFAIDEKRHHLYKRIGDDLDLGVEVPLIQALTGCTIAVPLLGGDTTTLTFDEILYPGYEYIIPGQGMPKSKKRRGDLRLRFLVEFPTDLSDDQRSEIVSILENSS